MSSGLPVLAKSPWAKSFLSAPGSTPWPSWTPAGSREFLVELAPGARTVWYIRSLNSARDRL